MTTEKSSNLGSGQVITIDHRFVGPPNMTQGGYISGILAMCLDCETVEVTMRNPTPMGKPLTLDVSTPDRVFLYDGEKLLNEARPAELNLQIPKVISLEEAEKASLRHVFEMPYPNCFGCGSARSEDDGLQLRSGPVKGRDLVAIDWRPLSAAVGAAEGMPVPQPIVWAAMECPIARAMELGALKKPGELVVLGRMTTRVRKLPNVGSHYFFMGWPIGREGRKIQLGGSLYGEDGQSLVETSLTFVTLREGVTYDSFR